MTASWTENREVEELESLEYAAAGFYVNGRGELLVWQPLCGGEYAAIYLTDNDGVLASFDDGDASLGPYRRVRSFTLTVDDREED